MSSAVFGSIARSPKRYGERPRQRARHGKLQVEVLRLLSSWPRPPEAASRHRWQNAAITTRSRPSALGYPLLHAAGRTQGAGARKVSADRGSGSGRTSPRVIWGNGHANSEVSGVSSLIERILFTIATAIVVSMLLRNEVRASDRSGAGGTCAHLYTDEDALSRIKAAETSVAASSSQPRTAAIRLRLA